ncbi:trans-aconitate 2-methyltransferase [Caballeronia hypogeia]|uniref:Trans-aconitate 2-methyltransferase n=1 Tax=Caballeronia hypogeia TaxID=1777140 RepID=A0A158C152_9BURK|nr:class I SAM-dependent methyltransferase [Caballeronia hypogeia]SAK76094.1 trans-aconitate 2-methyltransferase [Caballeronia hypogeia]
MKDINSKQYWDNRFSTDWVSAGGHEQTRFFAMIAAKAMPAWLKEQIRQEELEVCDWGCAEGQGVDELGKWIGTTSITGVDISEVAIEKARAAFPEARFKTQSVDQMEEYDIVFSSNTLEHFDRPFEVMANLAQRARRYLVVLLPFQEYVRISEHFFTFDFDNLPVSPAPGFSAVACRVVDAAKVNIDFWNGKQILVVYARLSALGDGRPHLKNLFVGDDSYEDFAQTRTRQMAEECRFRAEELSRTRSELAAVHARLENECKELADLRAKGDAIAHGLTADRDTMKTQLDQCLQKASDDREDLARAQAKALESAADLERVREQAYEYARELERIRAEAGQPAIEAERLRNALAHARERADALAQEGPQRDIALTEARNAASDLKGQLDAMMRTKTWRTRNAILKLIGR